MLNNIIAVYFSQPTWSSINVINCVEHTVIKWLYLWIKTMIKIYKWSAIAISIYHSLNTSFIKDVNELMHLKICVWNSFSRDKWVRKRFVFVFFFVDERGIRWWHGVSCKTYKFRVVVIINFWIKGFCCRIFFGYVYGSLQLWIRVTRKKFKYFHIFFAVLAGIL